MSIKVGPGARNVCCNPACRKEIKPTSAGDEVIWIHLDTGKPECASGGGWKAKP